MRKQLLMIPGPTPVPQEVASVMSTEMFNHRGPRFKSLIEEVTESLKQVFQTDGKLFVLTASGTGAMEAAIVNFIAAKEHVLSLVNGSFGERLAQISEAFGAKVERLASDWGKPLDYEALQKKLEQDRERKIKAITAVHNESSTGMMNDVELISRLRGQHPALLIVDTVSSMGAVDIPVDRWNIDVCLTASQKALMIPPGLSVISVREAAWRKALQLQGGRYYFSLPMAQEFLDKGQTPFTPAISQVVAMKKGLELYFNEGREATYKRHRRMSLATRAAMRALGLELLVEDRFASMTVTAVKPPKNIMSEQICKEMRSRFGVEIADGQGKLSGRIFRFGHLGAICEMDIITAVAALEMTLAILGHPSTLGVGVKAAQEIIMADLV